MSGFAGIVSPDGGTPDAALLQKMAARLAFRGPDVTHIWTRPCAGFCFTLLRTGPAPQAAAQPCTLDGNVWLLGDMRLDGRDDLRRELEQLGESTEDSATDEELILRVWRRLGEEGLPKLLGDFSFVLWDSAARELRCVRDLIGARPFYYASSRDWLCFSNTLEVVRLFPGVSSVLDPQFIGDFLLQESSSDASRTVYQDIRRLRAGHQLKYATREVNIRRYAHFPVEEPVLLKRPNDYVEHFQSLLEQAVRDRQPKEPSAIFLSGGLDSTSVAAVACAIAREEGRNGLRAYTMDCRTMFKDEEGSLAELVARHLGMEIEVLSGGTCLPYEGWEASIARMPEPCHDPFLFLGVRQCRQIHTHARVALSGYGGDDILTGQAWPYLTYLFRRRDFKSILNAFGSYVLSHGRFPPLRGGFRVRLRRWVGRKDPLAEFPEWLEPGFVVRHSLRDHWRELQEPPAPCHPLHPIAHTGLSSGFWAGVFESEDAACIGVPLDLRAPLLDRRLLRFLLRVPPVPWCMEKALLREAMRGMLPERIRTRPKVPVLGDSIKYFIDSKKWSPVPLPAPAAAILEYVDWKRLGATLETSVGSTLWVGLRPVSLSYWLKGIVNAERIG